MTMIVTSVSATVPDEREAEFLDGYRELLASPKPDGFVRSDLLHDRHGRWLVQTTWRDLESLSALRRAGYPPAAGVLLDRVGATTHTHDLLTVEVTSS